MSRERISTFVLELDHIFGEFEALDCEYPEPLKKLTLMERIEGAAPDVYGAIIKELINMDPFPITIHEDNRAASLIARNESSTRRTKHIDVKYHHIKDLVDSNRICIKDISSNDQLADIFTKPLPREKHEGFTHRLLKDITSQETTTP